MQLEIPFPASESPLHRERDRPPAIKPKHWSDFIDLVCIRGGVRFTKEALLADFHQCCPEYRGIASLRELGTHHLAHWEWYWERWRPWACKQS